MFTKFFTVHKTAKPHPCYMCGIIIPPGSTCTFGVTTDTDIVRDKKKGIETGYFCSNCRDCDLNDKRGKHGTSESKKARDARYYQRHRKEILRKKVIKKTGEAVTAL